MLFFTLVGILFVGFWLALAMLFSLLFQRTVTAALASLSVWLFLAIFVSVLAQLIANAVVDNPTTPELLARRADIETFISRLSPATLFAESVHILLNPTARVLGFVLESQVEGILPTPIAFAQSLLLISPHITTLVALLGLCFAISYIKFMREEIRA
jgi:ABC-2 type transport system permease protein